MDTRTQLKSVIFTTDIFAVCLYPIETNNLCLTSRQFLNVTLFNPMLYLSLDVGKVPTFGLHKYTITARLNTSLTYARFKPMTSHLLEPLSRSRYALGCKPKCLVFASIAIKVKEGGGNCPSPPETSGSAVPILQSRLAAAHVWTNNRHCFFDLLWDWLTAHYK